MSSPVWHEMPQGREEEGGLLLTLQRLAGGHLYLLTTIPFSRNHKLHVYTLRTSNNAINRDVGVAPLPNDANAEDGERPLQITPLSSRLRCDQSDRSDKSPVPPTFGRLCRLCRGST